MLRWLFNRCRRPSPIDSATWARAIRAEPLVHDLTPNDRERLRALVDEFVAGKRFETPEGFALESDMRARIALLACLPVLELGLAAYGRWHTVVVHPTEFHAPQEFEDEHGIVTVERGHQSGESWPEGPVVLSWADVEKSALADDSYNVVIHEFAHKLDMQEPTADGMPRLHDDMDPAAWREAWSAAFADFGLRVERGEVLDIDPYAAEDPAEFFAVMTEAFFEIPDVVERDYPVVYSQLREFYRQDPLARLERLSEPGNSGGVIHP